CMNPAMVLSEKTTPHPNVASARFRSITVMSQDGFAFLARIEKYNPAGPPPMQTIFMRSPLAALLRVLLRFRRPTRLRAGVLTTLRPRAGPAAQKAHSSRLRNSPIRDDAYRHSPLPVEDTPPIPPPDRNFSLPRPSRAPAIPRFAPARCRIAAILAE